jgi:zinc protease
VNQSFEVPEKANASLMAGVMLDMNDEDPDYPALTIANYMLGGGTLSSRLGDRIRQKEGLSYGVNSMLNVPPKEKNAMFMTFAISAPQNVPKVEAAFKEEVARALKDGFMPDEVEAAKKGWLKSQEVNRSRDQALIRQMSTNEFYGRTMAWQSDFEKKVAARLSLPYFATNYKRAATTPSTTTEPRASAA